MISRRFSIPLVELKEIEQLKNRENHCRPNVEAFTKQNQS